ncbi:MAG: PEP-CTERM sorting domain-containing protein [Methylacidiphilales bacterium]|nr:PEP-CTERM sorting domain-containing protein [Candidatus Methylacidiphilales bacterium]
MKKHLIKMTLLALAGMAFTSMPAKALTYSDGDLLLGFRATGGSSVTTDYVIDLGVFTQFTAGGVYVTGSPVNISIGGITNGSGVAADLSAQYGSDWYTNTTTGLLWGVAGTQKSIGNGTSTANTLFVSAAEPSNGTQSTPWNRASTLSQGGPAGKMTTGTGQGGVYATGSATANDTAGTFQSTSTTNSWAYQMPGGGGTTATSAYSTYSGTGGAGLEAVVSNTSANVLDLYRLNTGSGPGSLLGTLTLGSNGTVAFDAVPEPSTYAMLVGGVLALVVLRRNMPGKNTRKKLTDSSC